MLLVILSVKSGFSWFEITVSLVVVVLFTYRVLFR